MIILILLILLFQNKFSNRLNNGYLLLLLLLLLSTNDCNSNLNAYKNIYFKPSKPNTTANYHHYKNNSNRTPYNKDDYLKNYNKAPIKEPYNKDNTYSCNEYYNKKQSCNNSMNTNLNESNNEQYITKTASDKCRFINTISSKELNKPAIKELSLKSSNKNSSLKSTNTNSIINKNITCTKSIPSPTNKNSSNNTIRTTSTCNNTNININSNSIDCTNKIHKHPSINLNNISKGESVTVSLEGFGIITGKLLSHSNGVISLKLKDNKTIFINTNFISFIN